MATASPPKAKLTYIDIPPPPLPEFYLNPRTSSKEEDTAKALVVSTKKHKGKKETSQNPERQPGIHSDGTYEIITEKASKKKATPAAEACDVPPLAVYHICRICLRPRSARYHREHPIPINGVPPPPSICRRCRVASVEEISTVAKVVTQSESAPVKLGLACVMPEKTCIPASVIKERKTRQRMQQIRELEEESGGEEHSKKNSKKGEGSLRKDIVFRHVRVREGVGTLPREEKDRTNVWYMEKRAVEAGETQNANDKTETEAVPNKSEPRAPMSNKQAPSAEDRCLVEASGFRQIGKGAITLRKSEVAERELSPSAPRTSQLLLNKAAESEMRRIAREEVVKYRQAERKLEAHPDPYAHGRMTSVEPTEKRQLKAIKEQHYRNEMEFDRTSHLPAQPESGKETGKREVRRPTTYREEDYYMELKLDLSSSKQTERKKDVDNKSKEKHSPAQRDIRNKPDRGSGVGAEDGSKPKPEPSQTKETESQTSNDERDRKSPPKLAKLGDNSPQKMREEDIKYRKEEYRNEPRLGPSSLSNKGTDVYVISEGESGRRPRAYDLRIATLRASSPKGSGREQPTNEGAAPKREQPPRSAVSHQESTFQASSVGNGGKKWWCPEEYWPEDAHSDRATVRESKLKRVAKAPEPEDERPEDEKSISSGYATTASAYPRRQNVRKHGWEEDASLQASNISAKALSVARSDGTRHGDPSDGEYIYKRRTVTPVTKDEAQGVEGHFRDHEDYVHATKSRSEGQPPSRRTERRQERRRYDDLEEGIESEHSSRVRFATKIDVSPTPPGSDANSEQFRIIGGRKGGDVGARGAGSGEALIAEYERRGRARSREGGSLRGGGREVYHYWRGEVDDRGREETGKPRSRYGEEGFQPKSRPLKYALSESPSRESLRQTSLQQSEKKVEESGPPYHPDLSRTDSLKAVEGSASGTEEKTFEHFGWQSRPASTASGVLW